MAALLLEVELDDFSPASGHRFQILLGADPIKRDHLGAHIGQHHACEGTRSDAGKFDDTKTGQRAGGAGGGLWG